MTTSRYESVHVPAITNRAPDTSRPLLPFPRCPDIPAHVTPGESIDRFWAESTGTCPGKFPKATEVALQVKNSQSHRRLSSPKPSRVSSRLLHWRPQLAQTIFSKGFPYPCTLPHPRCLRSSFRFLCGPLKLIERVDSRKQIEGDFEWWPVH